MARNTFRLNWLFLLLLGLASKSQVAVEAELSFASPLGGSGEDQAFSVAIDAQGNIYVAGQTTSLDFPNANATLSPSRGGYDVFVTKYSPYGKSIIYSTILGGSGDDRGYHLAVTPNGQVVVVGSTTSTNFPIKNAHQEAFGGGDRDGFVAFLDATGGELIYATYLGGSGSDDLTTVAINAQGRICVGGTTQSTNLLTARPMQPANGGHADALIARFESSGKIDFCTYWGGSGGDDGVLALAVDPAGNMYLTGYTTSTDFPKVNPYQSVLLGGYEAFVAKWNANGTSVDFSTFLGGAGDDVGRGIAVDADGNVYVGGDTFSTSFPITSSLYPGNAGRRDLFVSKLDSTGSTLMFSTYLGGSGEELASLALDAAANVHLAGVTSSRNFPITSPFQPRFGGGSWDAFVATLKSDGSALLFASYLGGSGNDQISAIAADPQGTVYVAGSTTSTNIPTVNPLQPSLQPGRRDAFIAQVTPAPSTNIFTLTPLVAQQKSDSGKPPVKAPVKAAAKPQAKAGVKPAGPPKVPDALEAIALALPLFGKNLIVNGTAEDSPASLPAPATNTIPGWITDGSVVVGLYENAGSLRVPTNGGSGCFMSQTNTPVARASQIINVAPGATFIDSGDVRFNAGVLLGAWQEQTDTAAATLLFKDDSGKALTQAQLGPITGKDRSFFNRLVPRIANGRVPPGTRSVTVELELKSDDKAGIPARADNLHLVLLRPPASLLQVTREENQVELFWPAALKGVVLESSPALSLSAPWEIITNAPVLMGGQNTLILGIENADRYFRLRRQP
jgi:hypothetical protein